jgi:hypothetical protein
MVADDQLGGHRLVVVAVAPAVAVAVLVPTEMAPVVVTVRASVDDARESALREEPVAPPWVSAW